MDHVNCRCTLGDDHMADFSPLEMTPVRLQSGATTWVYQRLLQTRFSAEYQFGIGAMKGAEIRSDLT